MLPEIECPKRCGKCCIIFNQIPLTFKEIVSGRFRTKWNGNGDGDGGSCTGTWHSLALESKYIPEIGRILDVCVYYNPKERACSIYNNRPEICRVFDPGLWKEEIVKMWKKMKAGKLR